MMAFKPKQVARCLLAAVLCDVLLYAHSIRAYLRPTRPPPPPGQPRYPPQRLYIAANLFNAERILPDWSRSLMATVELFGPENCFVAIVSSGSTDATPRLLRDLQRSLAQLPNSSSSFDLDSETKQDALQDGARLHGWIHPHADTERPTVARRIPYLARQRDRLLEPFRQRAARGFNHDRIVILNDVYFEVRQLVAL
jgi:hypothetical protein